MNKYCQHIIKKFHLSYISRTFEQDDVSLFLIMTRYYSDKGSVFRELGDFLAHPDKKDRGLVIDNIEKIMEPFDEFIQEDIKSTRSLDNIPRFTGLSSEELAKSLQKIFIKAGLPTQDINEDDLAFRDFLFCLIFIMGEFKIEHRKKLLELEINYGHSLNLITKVDVTPQSFMPPEGFEEIPYSKYSAILPILSLRNIQTTWDLMRLDSGHTLNGYCVRRLATGNLVAMSFDNDCDNNFHGFFIKGWHWPLYDES